MTDLKTRVTEVSVLLGGAIVTRTGRAKLETGSREIWVRGITSNASRDSFRITGEGAATITNFDVIKQTKAIIPEADVSALRDELDELEQKLDEIDDQLKINEDRLNAVEDVAGDFSETFGRTFAGGDIEIQKLTQMDTKSLELIRSIKKRIRELLDERKDIVNQIQVLKHQIAEKSEKQLIKNTYDVRVSLDVRKTTEITLNVVYQCSSASWEPTYDINLTATGAKVRRIAVVRNQTGENWNEVDMVVSSARAGPVEAVEGTPLILREYVPRPSRRMKESSGGGAPMALHAAAPMKKRAPPPEPEMEIEEAEVEELEGGISRYEAPAPVTVKSGNKRPVDLIREELLSEVQYYWYPDSMMEVIAENEVTNGDSALMAGEAKIYADGEYIGETSIPFTSPREKRTLGTRIAHDVKAEKRLIDKTIEKAGLTRGKLRRKYVYRLSIENLSKKGIKIEVVDRIPHSNEPDLKVEANIDKINADKHHLGILTWNLRIPSEKKHTIEYEYEVEWESARAIYPPLP
ncbi:MAG: mucoidy inhibitor MuiA family protein [Candidatus Thorarchaeota archaeon]|nr:mucoidy inhibitor MuiA family protein [Candidatus Thorarchaeota archaeon]